MAVKQPQVAHYAVAAQQPMPARYGTGEESTITNTLPAPKPTTANPEDIEALKKKIAELEKKLAVAPATLTQTVSADIINQLTQKYEAQQKELLYAFQDQFEQLEEKLRTATPEKKADVALEKAKVEETYEKAAISLQDRKIQELYIAEGTLTPEAQAALEAGLPGAEQEALRQLEEKGIQPPKAVAEPTPTAEPGPTTGVPTTIHRIDHPRWWKNLRIKGFNLSPPCAELLVPPPSKGRLYVHSIMFSTQGANYIILGFGNAGDSGKIYVTDYTKDTQININFGESPIPCGTGGLTLTADDPVITYKRINGFVVYSYLEE